MNFDELGAALSTERERRGLRIEDVADHLKISARHLRALEEGDAAALPHPAYARGFIRSYAAYLGMSPDEIHNALNGAPAAEAASRAPLAPREPAPRERRSGRGGWGFLLVLLVLGGLGYAGWHWGLPLLSRLEKPRLAEPSPPLSSAQPAPAAETAKQPVAPAKPEHPVQPARKAEPAPEAPVAQKPAAPATATNPVPPVAERTGAANPAPTAEERVPEAPAREQAATRATAAADDEVASPGQHKVIITATEECWIHSNADKTDTRQFSLRKGDTFALTFARSLELKLGNAGGVQIRYDGQPMPAAGQSGQVRTVTFPPQESR